MKKESGIGLSSIKRIKAYFSSGKPALILKLTLPRADGENEAFNSRFNSFYEALLDAYILTCEKHFKEYDKSPRPATLSVEFRQNEVPGGKIIIVRSNILRLPDGECVKRLEVDCFDEETGLFIKEKRKRKSKSKFTNNKKKLS